jgi:C4-dicarboxylate transporter DctQ subunit
MRIINLILNRFEEIIVSISLAVGTILTFTEVILRYFFGSSLGFTHELVIYLLIATGLIGASIGVRNKVHIGVDLAIQQFPYAVQKVIVILTNLLAIGFCVTYTFLGIEQVSIMADLGLVTPEMQIPAYIPILLVPISFGLITIRFIQHLVSVVKTPAHEILQQEEGVH